MGADSARVNCDVVLDSAVALTYYTSMDAAHKSARKYPSYTLAQLEAFVAQGNGNPVMVAEIAARKAGTSNVLVVPQIEGGKPTVKVGRM